MLSAIVSLFRNVLHDERGLETLEWIAMAVLIIVLIAAVVYPGNLLGAVTAAITRVSNVLTGA